MDGEWYLICRTCGYEVRGYDREFTSGVMEHQKTHGKNWYYLEDAIDEEYAWVQELTV